MNAILMIDNEKYEFPVLCTLQENDNGLNRYVLKCVWNEIRHPLLDIVFDDGDITFTLTNPKNFRTIQTLQTAAFSTVVIGDKEGIKQ